MPKNTKERIMVGLSGGVDSAASAYLLKKAGYEVSAGFMINYISEEEDCPTIADLEEARRVAAFLDIPFYTFDYQEEYEKRIVEYIYREYEGGRTPNPDVFCNSLIKFDLFLEEAKMLGFNKIATGHYARIDEADGLRKGIDSSKDQSYFLSRLSKEQLSRSVFPIGHLMKSEVRSIARKANLPNAERKDSQGLCFIGKVSMKEFLEKRIPKQEGKILSTNGEIIGKHDGAFSYTIGQRRGIEIGGGPALFVVAKDTSQNTITVGPESELSLYSKNLIAELWIGEELSNSQNLHAKIRYRQEDQICTVENLGQGRVQVNFEKSQRAVSSGQIVVVYEADRVIGSGVIS